MNYKSSYSQGLQHSLTLFRLVMEPFWRLKPRLDFVNRASVLMIVEGRDSLRHQQLASERVGFVNKAHWRRSSCIDFPEGPIGKQQREPKVTNTHARHWMIASPLTKTPCLGSALRKGSISYIDKYSSICNLGTKFC